MITIKGKPATILFHYERVQKRCFHCQRLNHEKDLCPLVVRQRQEESRVRREKMTESLKKKQSILTEDDILFGIIDESLVGTDPATGRCKVAKDILEEMRRYMKADTGDSHAVKVDRVQQSLKETSQGTMYQRATLRLEVPPVLSSDLDRGKGLVFDYCENSGDPRALSTKSNPEKLLADSFKAHATAVYQSSHVHRLLLKGADSAESLNPCILDYSTVFRAGSLAPCSSGIAKNTAGARRRPPKAIRDQRKRDIPIQEPSLEPDSREGKQIVNTKKRKCVGNEEESSSTTKAVCLKVVPKEGLPNAQ